MNPETSIERRTCAKADRELGVTSLHLNVAGSDGWPDRIFLIPGGKPLFIEFKAPGEKPRPRQRWVHRLLHKLGYEVQVHDNVETAFAAVKSAVETALASKARGEISS